MCYTELALAESASPNLYLSLPQPMKRDIFSAVKMGPLDDFRKLYDVASNPNLQDCNGNSLLYLAVKRQRRLFVDFLLEQGADVTIANAKGNSPLIAAAYTGTSELCERLLARGADVNARSSRGLTPIMAAAITDNLPVARLLIQRGADASATDVFGSSAYKLALLHGSFAVAEYLQPLALAVNPLISQRIEALRNERCVRTRVCKHPFAAAVQAEDVALAATFESLGFKLPVEDISTLIFSAIHQNDAEMFSWLVAHLPNGISSVDSEQLTLRAVELGNTDVLQRMQKIGCVLSGEALLLTAIENRKSAVVDLLLPLSRIEHAEELLQAALKADNLTAATHIAALCEPPTEKMKSLLNDSMLQAVAWGEIDKMKWLAEHGVAADAEKLLLKAMESRQTKAVDWLLPMCRIEHAEELLHAALKFDNLTAATHIATLCEPPSEKMLSMLNEAMLQAVSWGEIDKMKWLAQHGAAADAEKLLLKAMESRQTKAVDWLLPMCRIESADKVLLTAFDKGYATVAEHVLQSGLLSTAEKARVIDLGLIKVAYNGNLEMVRRLLDMGANVNARDDEDRTPFNQALKRGIFTQAICICHHGGFSGEVRRFRSILELLLARGATLHAIEKHAALPSPFHQDMLERVVRDFGICGVPELIRDQSLALKIISVLPRTLTWL